LKNLLLFRYLITNGLGFAIFIWAWSMGYVHKVFERDVSKICEIIVLLFVIGLVSSAIRIWKVSRAKNNLDRGELLDVTGAKKIEAKNLHIYKIAEYLATLGLIGNALGFFIALDMAGTDPAQIAPQLLMGMGVAFGSTLAGAITGLWTWINFSMLETATTTFIEDTKKAHAESKPDRQLLNE
jgi:hypothetical protein